MTEAKFLKSLNKLLDNSGAVKSRSGQIDARIIISKLIGKLR